MKASFPMSQDRLEFRANGESCCITLLGHQIYVNNQVRPLSSGTLEFQKLMPVACNLNEFSLVENIAHCLEGRLMI